MGIAWTQFNEEAFISKLGDHSPDWERERRRRPVAAKIELVEGYLRALAHPRRWDGPMDVPRLRRVAGLRLDHLKRDRAGEIARQRREMDGLLQGLRGREGFRNGAG